MSSSGSITLGRRLTVLTWLVAISLALLTIAQVVLL